MPWPQCAEILGLPVSCHAAHVGGHPVFLQALELTEIGSVAIEVYAHAGPGAHIWEFQYAAPPLPEISADCEARVFDPDFHPFSLAQALSEEVSALTGYDRVMVYHFDSDWSGEIIAECRHPSQVPFLGLHYPATDIPTQARQLYRENAVRTITSVAAPTVTLIAEAAVGPLDLRHAILRAVSPYHIEYLANMGVGATLTLSILVEGELWGLVACHHNQAKSIPAATRTQCGELAKRTGRWLTDYRAREAARDADWAKRDEQRLQASLGGCAAEEFLARLFFGPERIDPLLEADAAVLVTGETWICTGDVPDAAWLRSCLAWCEARSDLNRPFASDRLPADLPPPENHAEAACGLLVARLAEAPTAITLLLFRRETLREVHWGGIPVGPPSLMPCSG
jgi:light-regulated signal transduction histidine kinase (bacteriophytochrome)